MLPARLAVPCAREACLADRPRRGGAVPGRLRVDCAGSPAGYAGQPPGTAPAFASQPLAVQGAPNGGSWGGADVQVCVQHSAIFDVSISRGPWVLLTRDGKTVPASVTDDPAFPQPTYPADHRRLHPGDCVRGWVVFALPDNERAVAVQYAPSGAQPINWAVR